MQAASGAVMRQTEYEVPREYLGHEDDVEAPDSVEWPLARIEVTQTHQQKRAAFLAKFAHPDVAPGNIQNMSAAQFAHIFGAAAAQRYEENRQQKHSASFDPQAYEFLKLVRQSRVKAKEVAQCLRQMSRETGQELDAGLVEVWENYPDSHTLEQFDGLKSQTEVYLKKVDTHLSAKNITKGQALSGLKKTHELLNAFRTQDAVAMSNEPARTHGRHAILQTEAELNNKMLKLKQQEMPREERDLLKAEWRLDNLKTYAASGSFCTDDLLRIAVGEPGLAAESEFLDGVAKKIKKSFAGNKTKKGDAYHSFYTEFEKILPDLMIATLGQTLFAFADAKPTQNWTPEDVLRLREFAESRYETLHMVFEKLANKKENPFAFFKLPDEKDVLPGAQRNEELIAFAHEVLRLSIYPNYTFEIRVATGGTQQPDPLVRASVYVVPAMNMLRTFDELNKKAQESAKQGLNLPELVIVDGSSLAVAVNGFDDDSTRENGQRLARFLHQVVEKFYPEQASLVRWHRTDAQQVFGHPIFPLLHQTMRELVDRRDTDLMEALPVLLKQALKYCGHVEDLDLLGLTLEEILLSPSDHPISKALDKALQYTAAHVMPEVFATLSWDDATARTTFKMGGIGERSFNLLQKTVARVLFTALNTPVEVGFPDALFMTLPVGGDPPVYYRDPDSAAEIGVAEAQAMTSHVDALERELLSRSKINDGAGNDLSYAGKCLGLRPLAELVLHCRL